MSDKAKYPRRLIEVDLPIKRISAQATREKSIRHGHISTLHIWWARRPLAACRAVLCAALWPDPADPLCPEEFREAARNLMKKWAKDHLALLTGDSYRDFVGYQKKPDRLDDNKELRKALLHFIADFSNWNKSTDQNFLNTSRELTQSAHEALGGIKGTKPLVVDPFAGGGAMPLEALRVGADAFASDLNPVAVLLNKVVLEYIPKYGQTLANEVRKWGEWIKKEAEKELAEFYPKDSNGANPIAYLWARTVVCEGPGCGAEVPLMSSLWIAKRSSNSVALKIIPNFEKKRVDFEIFYDAKSKDVKDGTVKRGSATCPVCGYTTPVASVRKQLKLRNGGAKDARLFCVVTTKPGQQGRFYRLPTEKDIIAITNAENELNKRKKAWSEDLSFLPDESTPSGGGPGAGRGFSLHNYGLYYFKDIFTPRQNLALTIFAKLCKNVSENMDNNLVYVSVLLSCVLSRVQDLNASLSQWANTIQAICGANRAQNRMPMVWDFVEANPIGDAGGNWLGQVDWVIRVIEHINNINIQPGTIQQSAAQEQLLPDDFCESVITDPPYYDAFGYSDLSDFFLVWLKRSLPISITNNFQLTSQGLTPKSLEIILDPIPKIDVSRIQDKQWFEEQMQIALEQIRKILKPDGIGVVVFANKSTSGWEALLEAILQAGLIITASWPIDTERINRQRAQNSAALGSSVHLVFRPRKYPDGTLKTDVIGDWRDILQELPVRIHEWMPHLASEGVVGADAIFACLGPALEIFSRYSRVEKASGEVVTLREYLEHIWAAVSKEALNMIFKDADASGFEEDSRLTAMWLWTLSTGNGKVESNEEEEESEEEESEGSKKKPAGGFTLEYDTARKIAQGLGAHMDKLSSVVEIKGNKARLHSVSERAKFLFGKNDSLAPKQKKKKDKQMDLFKELLADTEEINRDTGDISRPEAGNTVMDRLHQAMLLFGAGRSEALKRFLVEDAVGQDLRFWKLAQAMSALYPSNTDEKRWIDGVMTRKKGLGF